MTIIFFENGKEKNRISIDGSFDTKTMLIPALNQLPLPSVGQSTQPQTPATTDSTNSTESTTEATEQTTQEDPISEEPIVEQPVETDSVAQ